MSSPELAHEVLTVHAYDLEKSTVYHYVKRLLGLGLITSEGEFHKRQRKLVAPLLQHRNVGAYAETMGEMANRVQADWHDGEVLDVQQEMVKITLGIIGKTLFDADVLGDAKDVGRDLGVANRYIGEELNHVVHLPMWWPSPRISEARRAIRRLDDIIFRLIDQRRREGGGDGDILSMLITAQYEGENEGLSDQQVRDEAMTMFLAGHETNTTGMTWALFLLAQHPEAYERLRDEADTVLDGRSVTLEDLPKLPYALQVWKEALRLFPPIYTVGRAPLEDLMLGEFAIPKGANVMVNIIGLHHRPDLFPDSERFDPDRFTPENEKEIPRYAYIPFATGPRVCIGNYFALMEGQISLATLARHVTFELLPQTIDTDPLLTLRAKGGIQMRVQRRNAA